MQNFPHRCWAEIDLDALQNNFFVLQKLAGKSTLMPMVKANAYGHGACEVAKTLAKAGAEYFGVACLSEGLRLRKAGITQPILIMGYTDPSLTSKLAENNISQCVFSLEYAQLLDEKAASLHATLSVHFKIDTGMTRLGFCAKQNYVTALEQLSQAFRLKHLKVSGLFTHFSVADSKLPEHIKYTNEQFALFQRVLAGLANQGLNTSLQHCCNSGGLLGHPNKHLHLVRPGIALYGYSAGDFTLKGLKPALQLCASIASVQTIAAGTSISYGLNFTAHKEMRVATITTGYADGYPRLLSGSGIVSINGKPAPVLGRVCMDQLVVDVSAIPSAKGGGRVVLFGGKAGDSIESAAKKCQTISYEILCGIAMRVPRLYNKNNHQVHITKYEESENE